MLNVFPRDFLATGWHIGLKPKGLDFGSIFSIRPTVSAAVFTQNAFVGHPITVGRKHAFSGSLQAIIVNSANANVATGPQGLALVEESCKKAAEALGILHTQVLPSSTGVIARPLPKHPLLLACSQLKERLKSPDFFSFSEAICTTDAYPKRRSLELTSGIRILGVAKGAGMIQPNMATMLAYLCTDACMETKDLERLLQSVVNKSFNRISVDSDTSTSDTVAVLANGASEKQVRFPKKAAALLEGMPWPLQETDWERLGLDEVSLEFVSALFDICVSLAKLIAADGEGASKLIELQIREAKDHRQALAIGRSVINSPLVKTAIHGADPNWGRLLMAVGKTRDKTLDFERLRIFFGNYELGEATDAQALEILANYLKNDSIKITILLGLGQEGETFWGCDLTEDYVRLNSIYTT